MSKIRCVNDAIVLTASPVKIRTENDKRIGQIIQNRDAAASIYISASNGVALSFLEIYPSSTLLEDILPSGGELWAFASVDGTVITIVDKYDTGAA